MFAVEVGVAIGGEHFLDATAAGVGDGGEGVSEFVGAEDFGAGDVEGFADERLENEGADGDVLLITVDEFEAKTPHFLVGGIGGEVGFPRGFWVFRKDGDEGVASGGAELFEGAEPRFDFGEEKGIF